MSIQQILKNTSYHLDLFSDSKIAELEQSITTKQTNGKTTFYARCLVRDKSSNELVQNYDLEDALRFFLDEKESIPAYELGSTKKFFKRGDVVISRLRSYLKEIAIVDTPEEANCVGSSEFIVLRPNETSVSSELLLVYLRSLPVQKILKWCQSGSNHPRFIEDDLLAIKLPERIIAIQEVFQTTIRNAIAVHRESKRLLGIAKRGVEIAIEQDEAAAIRWIDERLKE